MSLHHHFTTSPLHRLTDSLNPRARKPEPGIQALDYDYDYEDDPDSPIHRLTRSPLHQIIMRTAWVRARMGSAHARGKRRFWSVRGVCDKGFVRTTRKKGDFGVFSGTFGQSCARVGIRWSAWCVLLFPFASLFPLTDRPARGRKAARRRFGLVRAGGMLPDVPRGRVGRAGARGAWPRRVAFRRSPPPTRSD